MKAGAMQLAGADNLHVEKKGAIDLVTQIDRDVERMFRALIAERPVAGFSYAVYTNPDDLLALFGEYLKRARAVRRLGSAQLDLAYVAAGRFDGFWELHLQPWDMPAGALIVQEAGGTTTDG